MLVYGDPLVLQDAIDNAFRHPGDALLLRRTP
jgi:hypothetical protein